ncbi:MAG: nucleotide exchange factor GrpE [Deltaproteobacteria bacterium]|nr:nucleotide exchange factor GrpE [Deltaproteobacteria bacterium]
MPKDQSKRAKDFADLEEVDAADTSAGRLDAAMREAVAAVEAVEKKKAGKGGDEEMSTEADEEAVREIERLQKEVATLKDASLRTLADFENYRKRMEREQKEVRRYALLEPMREFLPVVDNLQRALGSDGRAEDLKLGVEMILNQMAGLLQRFDVKEVEALGETFDPAVHEAVLRDTSSEVTEPTVTDELQKGYILHERLLRPAMVKVSMPEAGGSSGGETDSA